jgi:hypothetical protein
MGEAPDLRGPPQTGFLHDAPLPRVRRVLKLPATSTSSTN